MKKIQIHIMAYVIALVFMNVSVQTVQAISPNTDFTEYYKQKFIDEAIPEEAERIIRETFRDILYATAPYYDNITFEEIGNYKLYDGFVIYNSETDVKDEIYYYPVVNLDKIVLVISAIHTSRGWCVSASDEMVDFLNKIHYLSSDHYLLYFYNDELKVRNERDLDNAATDFEKNSYFECLQDMAKQMVSREPANINKIVYESNHKCIEESYTPAYSTDNMVGAKGSRICSLYNAKGQGSDPICWAASVATIVNYRKGTNYSARDVCDKEGTGYIGADISTKKKALKDYGITYKQTNAQVGWSSILSNIDAKYPIAMSAFDSSSNGHSTVLYGYTVTSNGSYITVFNPGTNNTVTLQYKSTGTTFSYNNRTWTWTKSLSYK